MSFPDEILNIIKSCHFCLSVLWERRKKKKMKRLEVETVLKKSSSKVTLAKTINRMAVEVGGWLSLTGH